MIKDYPPVSIVAVDPGGQGYAVRLKVHREPTAMTVEDSFSLTSYRNMDYKAFDRWCNQNSNLCGLDSIDRASIAIIEHPIAVARGIGAGLLSQGVNFGYALATLSLHFKRVECIIPGDWKRAFQLNGKKDNSKAELFAADLVGMETLIRPGCRKPDSGLVDAVLIGYYGYLNFTGEPDDAQD